MSKSDFILILFCSLSSLLLGQEKQFSRDDDISNHHIFFFIDSTNQISLPEAQKATKFTILQSPLKVKPQHPIWLKLKYSEEDVNFPVAYISVGNFDYIEMYVLNDKGEKQKIVNGRLLSEEEKILNSFPIHFPLKSAYSNKTIFFKISHENPLSQERVKVDFLTADERNLLIGNDLKRHNKALLLTGGIIGLFLVFLFFSAISFILTRKKYYIFYTIYIVANLAFLLVSAARFSNIDLSLSNFPCILTQSEPLLLATITISYNLFLKKFIAATRKIKYLDSILTGLIIYEFLIFVGDSFLKETFDHNYYIYKLPEIGLIPMFAVTLYFLFNLFKTNIHTLKLTSVIFFLLLWIVPILYVISPLGENQTFFLNPNMPFHLMMIAELIFFTLILANEEYQYKIKQDKEKIEMENQLTGLEKAALQAQMNPHFISNCLTSIQSFILKNDRKKAVEYLGKFARLARLNLDASVNGEISIAEEAELLENYLALEKQRCSGRFDYTISIAEDLAADTYALPPLLIQPYVENAVLHGVRNKKSDGLISINFARQGDSLIVKIKDNGIGYKKSESKKITSNHKSVGMSITHRRLELFGRGENVTIRDLSEDNSSDTGTEITVNLKLTAHV